MRDLSLHLLDIIMNSIRADADRISVAITKQENQDLLRVRIEDNGKGMSPAFVQKVTDPFATTRTTRKVGLGIPLFKEACEITGGSLTIESWEGVGTTLTAQMRLSSIDRLPLGNMGETLAGLIRSYPDLDFIMTFSSDTAGENTLDTAEVREKLDGVPLSSLDVYVFLRDYIGEQQEQYLGGI